MTIEQLEREILNLPPDEFRRLAAWIAARGGMPQPDRRTGGVPPIEPRDDWERRLMAVATDSGVSLPHEALGRDAIYD